MTRSSRFAGAALVLILVSLLAAPLVGAARPPNAGPPPHAGPNLEVQILAVNDFHGQLRPADPAASSGNRIGNTPAGGSEALADYVRALRATNPNTLFVSAGDLIGATPLISGIFHDEPTIEAMNLIGLDYNGVGNHEFDEGIPELLRMQDGGCHPVDGCFPTEDSGFDGANFPFLAANVTYEDTGETIFPPYAVHEFKHANIKVAIVGMTLEGTPSVVTQEAIADVDFHDEADTVNALIPELQAQGIQTIIVLLHEGGSTNQALNESTVSTCGSPSGPIVDVVQRMNPEIDLVVTGHTNWALNCPNFAGTGIMVTGAGSIGRVVTDVDLSISKETKDVASASVRNVIVCNGLEFPAGTPRPCPNIKPDANHVDITALIAEYAVVAAPIENQVIGFANAALTRDETIPPFPNTGESSLGDIIADAQLWATSAPDFPGGPAVIAFMNAGGIRRNIDEGPITYGEAFEVQPFANVLTTMDMTGAQILAVLQQQFTGSPLGNGILQISDGLTYTRTSAGATGQAGDLMSDVELDGVPINPAATYRVTVNNFLAGGGDNFTVFAQGVNRFVGEIDLEAFRRYLETFSPIDPGPRDRITFVVP
ncbi:MAG TPA: bifunctional metallophosphatase/5'-nucleotidase [Candidatus Limnocylindria bacterium]|nr:bifunctional metallophosphatase/5'-nucleotidase [Candidatus Limnocylindria bacterium]